MALPLYFYPNITISVIDKCADCLQASLFETHEMLDLETQSTIDPLNSQVYLKAINLQSKLQIRNSYLQFYFTGG
jgi:hypothetical protein